MKSFSSDEEEDVFFDSIDKTPVDCSPIGSLTNEEQELEFRKLDSEFWKNDVMTVRERRRRFLSDMCLDDFISPSETNDCERLAKNVDLERVTKSGGATLDSLSNHNDAVEKDLDRSIRDLDSGKKFIIHDLEKNGLFCILKEVDSNKLLSIQEFETLLGLTRSVQKFMQKEATPSVEKVDNSLICKIKNRTTWWKRLLLKRPLMRFCKKDISIKNTSFSKTIRAKVLQHNKKCLEFSALYMSQEIRAHKGVIRAMKFDRSGCYLASGGEDCVVRIWLVKESEASCKCSSANMSCEFVDKVRDRNSMLGRKSIYSAPIVIPKKIFMIDETPFEEFHGHRSDILDLSWSSNSDCLLTSSMDKTVRMWKVGFNECLKVFQHNDYVTSIQFNPVDDKYFITGSIDGKVRIWSVSENHVVDWADIREIVTAVCYSPNAERFVVGSITGNCRFYYYEGNVLQLETQFCIQGKKKSAGKPITGLQFSPEDAEHVMITSTDSRVRIFDRQVDVIGKFRGLRKTKSHLSASFSSDGRYIISSGEDSYVYIWNYESFKGAKSLKSVRSCELFSSEGVSIAIPYPSMNRKDLLSKNTKIHLPSQPVKILEPSTWLWDPDLRSFGAWLFSKVNATWPEEKLAVKINDSIMHHNHHHHHWNHYHKRLSATWNLVIVTASCNGTIRTFHNYGLPVRL